jgi:hypothetical protein
MLAQLIADGRVGLVDGTLISLRQLPAAPTRSEFAPAMLTRVLPSKSRCVWVCAWAHGRDLRPQGYPGRL